MRIVLISDTMLNTLQLQLVSDREHDSARAFLARGDVGRAKTALRRRRYQETLLQKTDGQLETLEGLVSRVSPHY